MNFWFSRRLSLGKGTPASTSTGAVIAMAGVALALMVMELSLAIVAGFKHEIERKVTGFDAPVSILPAYDYYTGTSAPSLSFNDSLRSSIMPVMGPRMRPVEEYSIHAILKTDDNFLAVNCIGYGEGHDYSFQRDILTSGHLPEWPSAGADSIVVSESIARKLNLGLDDRIYLYFFADNAPKMRRAFVSGTYRSDFGDYDDVIVYSPITMLRGVARDSAGATAVNIEGVARESISGFTDSLQQRLLEAYSSREVGGAHPVTNVLSKGAVFFNWLDLLDTNVVVIFVLMTFVAAFTLVSSLFIIILDRVPLIGILRAMGATRRRISNIFILLALRLVGAGMAIGNLLAIGTIAIQHYTHFIPLDPRMYYLDHVPVLFDFPTLLWLNVGVAVGAWLILILPARIASSVDPAVAMRYE